MPNPSPSGDLTKIWDHIFHFNIVDLLRVPRDIESGEYTLSFRWDCEQTPQICEPSRQEAASQPASQLASQPCSFASVCVVI
jgi:hypothetical protein